MIVMRSFEHANPTGRPTETPTGAFCIVKETEGRYWFVLVDHKDNLLLRGSEGHNIRMDCEMSIEAVRLHAPHMIRYVMRGFAGCYSFALKDANGRVIGLSGVHARERGRRKHIEAVQCIAGKAMIVDLSQRATVPEPVE